MHGIYPLTHTLLQGNSCKVKRSIIRLVISAILLLFYNPMTVFADNGKLKPQTIPQAPEKPLQNYYYSKNIIFQDHSFQRAVKLFRWLDLIKLTTIGKATLSNIENTPHQLIFYHSDHALNSAGTTGAPLTRNLTNGNGEDAYIKFYFDMTFSGSNCVLGQNGQYIEYTALQNLFHELSHARHKMNGTWLYFDSEGQAIREENQFRYEWSQYRYETVNLRTEDIEEEEIKLRVSDKCLAYHTVNK